MVVLQRLSGWQAVTGPRDAENVRSPADVLKFKCNIWKMFWDIQICRFSKGQDQQLVHNSHGCQANQQAEGRKRTEDRKC